MTDLYGLVGDVCERLMSGSPEVPRACRLMPLDDAVSMLESADPWRGYRFLPRLLMDRFGEIRALEGEAALKGYLVLLLARFAQRFPGSFERTGLSDRFRSQFESVMHRMFRQAQDGTLHTAPDDDVFLKDLAVVRLRMFPCVSHLVYRYSGVPRQIVMHQPLHRIPSLLAFIAKAGGFRPYLENHVHLKMLDAFNETGRERCYRLVSELLLRWPESKGLIGSSWYYDPQVGRISSRLAYLHDVPAAKGARLINVGREGRNSGALARSASRRRAFETGQYTPATYMMIWPRRAMLEHYS